MSKGQSVIKFACSAKSKPPLHRSCRWRLPRLQAVAPMPRFTEALRDVRRRPLRSGLTVGGIAIGVAALALLGALSEKLSRLVEGGRDFATGQITVGGSGTGALTGMTRGGLLSGDQLAALREVPGVATTAPIIMFPIADAPATLPFTIAPLVFGVDMKALMLNRRTPPPRARSTTSSPPGSGTRWCSAARSPATSARR